MHPDQVASASRSAGALRAPSLPRMLLDSRVRGLTLEGTTLDLGSSQASPPSYYRRFHIMDGARAVTVDILPAKRPHVLADLESGLPFRDHSIANVVMFNVLEHVYNSPRLCAEVFRVLRPRGKCYVFVPFLYRIHDEPNDYFRYSQFALQRMLVEAGFPRVEVQPLGFGPFTTAWSFVDQVVPSWLLRGALTTASLKLDRWLEGRTPHFPLAHLYPLACFATAAKG